MFPRQFCPCGYALRAKLDGATKKRLDPNKRNQFTLQS